MGLTGDLLTNDIILNWALTALAGVLTIGRYVIRWYYSQKLYWDDLSHMIALLLLIAHGATNEVTLEYKAEVKQALTTKAPASVLLQMEQRQSYLNTINNCLLYTCMWAVKITFLLFYRHLFHSNKKFNVAWWIVLIITCCLIWAPLGGVLATCASATTLADYQQCSSSNSFRTTKLIYTCVVNVLTDVAIMLLPLAMLRTLKIRLKQKMALAFVFSLAIVTIVLDIVRTVEAIAGNQDIYTVIEITFTVILSCLPSYRALFNLDQRKGSNYYKYGRGSVGTSQRGIFSSFRSRMKSTDKGTGISTSNNDDLTEMKGIRIQQGFTVEHAGGRDPYHIDPDSGRQSLVNTAGVSTEVISNKDEHGTEHQPQITTTQIQSTSYPDPNHHSIYPHISELA